MMKLLDFKTDFIEKLFRVRYFLLLLSLVLFADTYLLAFHQTSISQIDQGWLRRDASLTESLRVPLCLGFFYAVVVPGLQFFLGLFMARFERHRSGLIHISHARNLAIRASNALAYQECEKTLVQAKELNELEAFCLSILVLAIGSYCFGAEAHPSLVQALILTMDQLPWYLYLLAMIPIGLFGTFVLMVSLREGRQYDSYIERSTLEAWGVESAPRSNPAEDATGFLGPSEPVLVNPYH